MNYRQTKELMEREQRRELILSGRCPHCSPNPYGLVLPNPSMDQASPKFNWFTCGRCQTTMGVQKRTIQAS